MRTCSRAISCACRSISRTCSWSRSKSKSLYTRGTGIALGAGATGAFSGRGAGTGAGAGTGLAGGVGSWAMPTTDPATSETKASVIRFIAPLLIRRNVSGRRTQPRNDVALFERAVDEVQLRAIPSILSVLKPDDLREHELEILEQGAHLRV